MPIGKLFMKGINGRSREQVFSKGFLRTRPIGPKFFKFGNLLPLTCLVQERTEPLEDKWPSSARF